MQRNAIPTGEWPYEALRLPSPSAIIAVTSVFKLTPSWRALAARRAWRLRGTRCRHCPLAALGLGMGSPCLAQLKRSALTASQPCSKASSGVSPSEMHPGRSGYSMANPPPSAAERGRMVNGWERMRVLSIFILCHLRWRRGLQTTRISPALIRPIDPADFKGRIFSVRVIEVNVEIIEEAISSE